MNPDPEFLVVKKFKNLNKDLNKKFFDEFQDLLKLEIENINTAVDNTVPNYIYATHVLSSKIKIFKFFSNKLFEYQEIKENNSSKLPRELLDNIIRSSEHLISKKS